MKRTRFLAVILFAAVLTRLLGFSAEAATAAEIRVRTDQQTVEAGQQVTAIFSLDASDVPENTFAGLQIDVEGVDDQILTPVEYTSMIDEANVASNTGSFNPGGKFVRFLYFQMNTPTQYLHNQDVFKVVFRVNPEVAQAGSVDMNVVMRLQMSSGEQITRTTRLAFDYTPKAQEVTSVDLSWGALEYTYTDGVWDPTAHRYDGGWSDGGTGWVTLTNQGIATAADFTYTTDRTDISGSFLLEGSPLAGPLALAPGEEKTVALMLSGIPGEVLDHAAIGTVTVRIGGE